MIIDVRRHLRLGVREKRALVAVPTPKAAPGTAFPPRRLNLGGVPIFELSLWCGTCPALFNRLAAPESTDLGRATALLNQGLNAIDEQVLRAFGRVLPKSRYTALLLDVTPELVSPGDPSDYFTHEQVATWGIDPVLGAPEDPGTPYYRTFEAPVAGDRHLYEFVVPMVPPSWNDDARVDEYAETSEPATPTAASYSLLDVMQPAIDESDDYYEHWVLSHFLLDGHHKVEAAAAAGRPIRLLSLIDERISMAIPDEFATLLEARAKPRERRDEPEARP